MNPTETKSDCIVVGLFDSQQEATDVMRELQSRGVPASSIRMDEEQGGHEEPQARQGLIQKLKQIVTGQDTHRYAEGVRRGGVVVSVAVPEHKIDETVDVMEQHNAVDIDERSESWRAAGWEEEESTAARQEPYQGTSGEGYAAGNRAENRNLGEVGATHAKAGSEAGEEMTIPIVEERVAVGKREVQRGRVRVYTKVSEEPVEQDVTLREERVVVERIPANRPADQDQGLFREESFEFPENAEEVVIGKEARVVGEVHVAKEARERTEHVRDTVRRTDVGVEQERLDQERQTRGEPHPFASDFQSDFRTRYAATGGSYDQYDPAYRWGYTLANQDEWRGRPWGDVESYAKRTWETRNPGTWERFKDAVRYGWDRLTGEARKPEPQR